MLNVKTLLTGCLYLGLGGTAATFESSLGLAGVGLLGVLHGMVSIIAQNTQILNEVEPQTVPPVSGKKNKPQKKSAKEENVVAGVNSDIFAQFKNNLSKQGTTVPEAPATTKAPEPKQGLAQKAPVPVPPVRPSAVPVPEVKKFESLLTTVKQQTRVVEKQTRMVDNTSQDKVSLTTQPGTSTKAKPSHEPSKPAIKPQTPENLLKKLAELPHEEDDDMFADVQIPLGGELKKKDRITENEDMFDDGLGSALQAPLSQEEKKRDAEALLKMAETFCQSGNWGEAVASLETSFHAFNELKLTPPWESMLLYTKACLKQGDITKASTAIQQLRTNGLSDKHAEYTSILESLSAGLEEQGQYETALPLLNDLLNNYRQQLNRLEMDNVYERIERAQEVAGDDEKLIRTYKNHLEIKRILKDRYGESKLLDLIGNRYYKMGEKELSRQYYEDNMRLKNMLEKMEVS
ncbi:MAG: hypothetical protein HQM12_05270 [SAR324 cluster bacterium]|nr:hypothetical protein [SAR324 cluster bacterium]